MFGIGLGGFVDGFTRGMGLREEMKDREQNRLDRAEDRKWRAEDRAFQQEERAFARSERQRQLGQRNRIEAIQSDARQEFAQGVEAGTYKESEFDKFWVEYAMPRLQGEYIMQGDIDSAKALADWSTSTNSTRGRNLFATALAHYQSGNHAKALEIASEAANLPGYGPGMDFRVEELTTKKGDHVGWAAVYTDADGNEFQQEMDDEDVGTFISGLLNPQATFEAERAAAAKAAERQTELETYESKKEIDQRYSTTNDRSRADAIKALRDQYKPDPFDDSKVSFDAMPREEQERLIAQELSLQQGGSSQMAPTPRVIVDNQTGQRVQPSSASSGQPAPGLGQSPKPSQTENPAVGISPRPNAVINGVEDPSLPAPPSAAEAVDMAAREMVNGGDPQAIARQLQAMGVPQSKWPESVTRPLTQSGR